MFDKAGLISRPGGPLRLSADLIFFALLLVYLSLIFLFQSLNNELFFNGGDEARYALDGAFYWELFKGGHWLHPTQFLKEYFDRYPALSIHLAQPILPLLVAASYSIFGISVFSAKLVTATLGFLAVLLFYRLLSRQCGQVMALISASLFATSHLFLLYITHLSSEVPGIFAVILIASLLLSPHQSRRIAAMILAVLLPFLLNHKLFFLYPTFATYYSMRNSTMRSTLIKGFLMAFFVALILTFIITRLPLPGELKTAFHTFFFQEIGKGDFILGFKNLFYYLGEIIKDLTPVGAILALVSIVMLGAQRELLSKPFFRYSLIFCLWNLIFFSLFGSFRENRFMVYSLPFALGFVGSLIARLTLHKQIFFKLLGFGLLICLLVSNAWVYVKHSHYVRGYEKAARYAMSINASSLPVLFDGYQDGNFIFFIRSLDKEKKQRVYRSDKIIFLSHFNLKPWNIKLIAKDDEDTFKILDRNHIRYIVSESMDFKVPTQQQFRHLLDTDPHFKKLEEFPIDSDLGPDQTSKSTPGYRDQKLTVYEYVPKI